MSLDPDDPRPPYQQIAGALRAAILSKEIPPGERLPSGPELAERYGVARQTVRDALRVLRDEGLTVSRQGSGTFVRERAHNTPKDRLLSSRHTGRIYPSDEYARIKSAELVEAPEYVAGALGVETGAQVVRRHRVTYKGEVPVSMSVSWFHGSLAETAPLLLQAERMPKGTPRYIEEMTGRAATTGRDQTAAGAATQQHAEDLDVEEGAPVLYGRNWFYDAEGKVIEYGESVSTANRWSSHDYELGSN